MWCLADCLYLFIDSTPTSNSNFEKFKDKLTMAVVGHSGFGTVWGQSLITGAHKCCHYYPAVVILTNRFHCCHTCYYLSCCYNRLPANEQVSLLLHMFLLSITIITCSYYQSSTHQSQTKKTMQLQVWNKIKTVHIQIESIILAGFCGIDELSEFHKFLLRQGRPWWIDHNTRVIIIHLWYRAIPVNSKWRILHYIMYLMYL